MTAPEVHSRTSVLCLPLNSHPMSLNTRLRITWWSSSDGCFILGRHSKCKGEGRAEAELTAREVWRRVMGPFSEVDELHADVEESSWVRSTLGRT